MTRSEFWRNRIEHEMKVALDYDYYGYQDLVEKCLEIMIIFEKAFNACSKEEKKQ